MHSHVGQRHSHQDPHDSQVDPVCGMTVQPDSAHRSLHAGHVVLFCTAGCKRKFDADPAKYRAGRVVEAPSAALAAATFTCPMHPEVIQQGPGSCPKCGMALEPTSLTADSGENPELAYMRCRWRPGCCTPGRELCCHRGLLLRP